MLRKIVPFPHIPGSESSGMVEQVGSHVNDDSIKKGDRVVVHNKVFGGNCDMCSSGFDMLCRNGGLIGAITNGVALQNIFQYPKEMFSKFQIT